MKSQINPEECGVNVRKVQTNKKGEISIKVTGKKKENLENFQ